MVLLEELECGCCYELMVNPTTLTCGHSFCRYCLAKWFHTSNKTECPECRQTWTGFPHVNVHLRTIAEKSFPKEANERRASQACLQDYSEITEKFETLGQGKSWQQAGNVDDRMVHGIIGLMFLGACIMVALSLIVVLYYYFTSSPKSSTMIYFRTVDRWTPLDVGAWAQGFTNQLGYDYSMHFTQAGINGQLLVGLTHEDLASPPLNISTRLHRKIFIDEIRRLNMTRVKHPTNLWEYKNAHQGNVLFLLFMLQDSPRLTFVYLHYMEYHTIFLPFLRGVIDREDCGDMICSFTEDYVTVASKLRFYLRVIFFPYYLILKYSWQFTDIHFFTMWMIISHCVMLTFGELARLYKLPGIIRNFPRKGTEYVVTFVITCIWYWSLLYIVPTFLLDIVFYGKLYYSPIETANKMRNGDFRATILRNIFNCVAATGERIWRIFQFILNRRI